MKVLAGLVVVLVLLAVGLVLADRAGESYASNLIADQLTSELQLPQKPSVTVTGTPFLTQWAAGDYREIRITIPTLTTHSVTVEDVDATLQNVHTQRFLTSGSGLGSATAGSVHLSGLVPFSALHLPSGFTVSASGSQLKVSGTVSILGFAVPVSALERISLQGSTVTFTPGRVEAQVDGVDVNVPSDVAAQLHLSVDVSGLPFGVQVTSVAVNSAGLVATAQGQNVSLRSA